tara:strand:- start:11795 stop:12961 length:1167 start_codon:yes stop_codon:yes gene_type:complete
MKKNNIPYGRQFIDKQDIKEVVKSLKSKFITTGNYVKKFEEKIKKKFNSKYAVSCSSATAGLHLAFKSINLKKNDVILMPSINFISSYSMAKQMGAKIYLVDIDSKTGQMTSGNVLDCIKKNKIKKVKALISMYLGGYVENNIDFFNLKNKLRCYLIEDACHAIGSEYLYKKKYYKIGSCKHSDICVFSFHPVKSITTGEGGAVLTNKRNISKKLRILRNHGILRKKKYWNYNIQDLGYNYRLSDINCALGFNQLNKIKIFYKKRKNIFSFYRKKLQPFKKYIYLPEVKNKRNFYHLFLLGINFRRVKKSKDDFIKYLNKKKIFPQFHYVPIYKFSFFKKSKIKEFDGTEQYSKSYLSLPIYYELNKNDQSYIINCIISYLKKNKKIN